MSNDELTSRQLAVYEFIREKVLEFGFSPTIREICDEFEIKSPNGVMCHLTALEKKGLIKRSPNKSRAIELIGGPIAHCGLPLKGSVAAGSFPQRKSHTNDAQRIDFTELFDAPGRYAMQIRGDSMIDAHIQDGDYVVVSPSSQASNGEIVVAETDNGETTLKYWFQEKDRVRLQPANPSMKPMYFENARVLGKIVGVVRST